MLCLIVLGPGIPTFLCLLSLMSPASPVSPTKICSAVYKKRTISYQTVTAAVTLNKSAICSLENLFILLIFLNFTSFSSFLSRSTREVLRPNILSHCHTVTLSHCKLVPFMSKRTPGKIK